MKNVIIIGAGISGLSATLELAKENINVILVSSQPSERAQSVMAEGGINAAMNTKGEDDNCRIHAKETLDSAAGIVDENAVINMTKEAPDIIRKLLALGVNFNMNSQGEVELREFGGQKKCRTVFAGNCTGKQIMTALIDAVRKEEVSGKVTRYFHHEFVSLIGHDKCEGCNIKDAFTDEIISIKSDAVIMACGGMHGLFENTTGSLFNTGKAQVTLFSQGVCMSNLEMIQYHPTTLKLGDKRVLITEAARAEGGRLYSINEHGEKSFFMEERYPELGNLMPRDITTREIFNEMKTGKVFLDMTSLDIEKWNNRLFELRSDMKLYFGIDPAKEPICIEPGIHYFMGGIKVDIEHRTNINDLYAIGECAVQYHGANRLGGNSLLGAMYSGIVASRSIISGNECDMKGDVIKPIDDSQIIIDKVSKKLVSDAMGIVRTENKLKEALDEIEDKKDYYNTFLKAFLESAIIRKESRGAHFREDYNKKDSRYESPTIALFDGNSLSVCMQGGGES